MSHWLLLYTVFVPRLCVNRHRSLKLCTGAWAHAHAWACATAGLDTHTETSHAHPTYTHFKL